MKLELGNKGCVKLLQWGPSMVPASEAQCMFCHLNIRTKCGKEGSLREDLRQDTVEKTLLLQIACCGILHA